MKLNMKQIDVTIYQCDRCIFLVESREDRQGVTSVECVNADRFATLLADGFVTYSTGCNYFSPLTQEIKL